ncbi:hypothetical protein J2741_000279 [Methanolinea mesophila]|uniref:Kelch repeat-containing protein n=1 Tax=Methanolinea mesophila TaxID=547055 RepID=UPI001AE72F00|nr:kelch repeat-containing protein [Methanolinea mesophila]MBP1927732.1 hypothetical protein [Methanolinea mesophila]
MKSLKFIGVVIFLLSIGLCVADSQDNIIWVEKAPITNVTPRAFSGMTAFQGKIWLLGGLTNTSSMNDVWSSEDGEFWNLVTDHAAFTPRYGHGIATFQNRLWIIGGISDNTPMNDVYSSTDGKNWTRVTNHAGFSPRYFHGVVVFNDRLWVIGGSSSQTNTLNDIWSSLDGINWTRETKSANFLPRHGEGTIDFNNQIWVIGGYSRLTDTRGTTTERELSDVWSSVDGVNWIQQNSDSPFPGREFVPVISANGSMYVIGGGSYGYSMRATRVASVPGSLAYNDVWISSDGINWTKDPNSSGFSPRYGQGVVVINDSIVVFGGLDPYYDNFLNDCWSGVLFSNEPTVDGQAYDNQNVTSTENFTPIPTTTPVAGSNIIILSLGILISFVCIRFGKKT